MSRTVRRYTVFDGKIAEMLFNGRGTLIAFEIKAREYLPMGALLRIKVGRKHRKHVIVTLGIAEKWDGLIGIGGYYP